MATTDHKYISEGSYRDWTGYNVSVPGHPKKLFQVSVHGSRRAAMLAATKHRNSLTKPFKLYHNNRLIFKTCIPKGDSVYFETV